MNLATGLFLIGTTPVSFSSDLTVLETGVFTLSSPDVTFTLNTTTILGTGIFTIVGENIGIYGACGCGNIIDALATDAPYPPPAFFVPITNAEPTTVLSPEAVFGAGSTNAGSAIYMTYYDPLAQLWNDVDYELQYPGQVIPPELKGAVSDQTYLYNQYLAAIALWQSEYDRQKLFQWPYYWAQSVSRATGSIPGGMEECGCGCNIPLSPDTIVAATQTVLGGTGVSIDDKFDIGGTQYTVGQLFAMVLKNLAVP